MRAIEYALKQAWASLWRGRASSVFAIVAIALAMTVLGTLLLLTSNVEQLLAQWTAAAEFSVYLRDDATSEQRGTIEALVAASQLDDAFGPNQIGAEVEVAFQTGDGETRRRRLTKRAVTIPTVSLTRVITVDGRRVGYVFFRNFVRPSFAALDAAFATLREANVSELVLDLRYNGGGLVDVAVHLASLIAGDGLALRPSGLIGSIVGAVIVGAGWQWWQGRKSTA